MQNKTSGCKWVGVCLMAACCLLLSPTTHAAWVVGLISDLSGPSYPGSAENVRGAKLYFDATNAKGGIHGKPIEVIVTDDQFDPKQTRQAAEKLIQNPAVVSLFLIRGTPTVEGIMPLLTEKKIALVAPSTGAMSLHQPVHPWIFNVRASYQTEAQRIIDHLGIVGTQRIALIYIDNSFGQDAIKGAIKGMKSLGKEPVLMEKFSATDPDFKPIVQQVKAQNPQAILMIGAAKMVGSATAQLRESGVKAQITTLSNNASLGFIQGLGEHKRGVVVSQVFPNEHALSYPLIVEAHNAAKAAGLNELTPAMVEGYAGAKVMAEGIRRAGPQATRAKLRDALENIKEFDLGGLKISYSPTDHSGLDFVDLSIIDSRGRFSR